MYDLPLSVFNHGFKFPDFAWNGFHDLTVLYLAISDYHCYSYYS